MAQNIIGGVAQNIIGGVARNMILGLVQNIIGEVAHNTIGGVASSGSYRSSRKTGFIWTLHHVSDQLRIQEA